MRIELERRAAHSIFFSALSPFIALGLTLVAGIILFTAMGLNPATALYSFFIEPLTEVWSLHELVIKATPLVLIAVGLSICFSSGNWNIGAEGQLVMGLLQFNYAYCVPATIRSLGITRDATSGNGRRCQLGSNSRLLEKSLWCE